MGFKGGRGDRRTKGRGKTEEEMVGEANPQKRCSESIGQDLRTTLQVPFTLTLRLLPSNDLSKLVQLDHPKTENAIIQHKKTRGRAKPNK